MNETNKDKYDGGPKSFGLSARSKSHSIKILGSIAVIKHSLDLALISQYE
jgi:hypothetical protein